MVARRSPAEIIAEDKKWKDAVDPHFERDALRLHALYEDRGRRTVTEHLRGLGMGDRDNFDPTQVGTIPRLIEMLSVLYERPAFRALARDEKPIDGDAPASRAFRRLAARMPLNLSWSQIDQVRNLLRQAVVVFAESAEHRAVVARVFEPYSAHRWPTAGAADVLDSDEAIALCVRYGAEERDRLYQTWQRQDDSSWRCWLQRPDGQLVGEQPYGDEGRPPFGVLPAILVTDQLLLGKAWLPIPQGRLSLALNIDAIANDVQLLVKHEGHSMTIASSPDPAGIPDDHGPDRIIRAPADTKYYKIDGDPKIEDASRTVERYLALLALAESLPVNAFAVDAQPITGAQLMVAERDLARRRRRQAELARTLEAQSYRKYCAVARAFPELDLAGLEEDLDLLVAFPNPSQYRDVSEQQNVSFRELALGTKSMLMHFSEMQGVSLEDGRILHLVVEQQRVEWPTPAAARELIAEAVETSVASTSTSTTVAPGQNPAAMVKGPKPAVGRGGAQKTPGAFNPDPATSTEGASVLDAVRGS